MANTFFQFKQFTVNHDRCAMKVGTDGVLLGAWTDVVCASSALDVGTGTGLIALMMAQRNPAMQIDAIDIDADAINQAMQNCNQSPFADQISLQQIDLLNYLGGNGGYDVIVSNPPFFSKSLKSPDGKRSLARHTDSLSIEDLISKASNLLSLRGRLSLIYPDDERGNIQKCASGNKLYTTRVTTVYSTLNSIPKRILIELSKIEKPLEETSLLIEIERHKYSDEFTDLVKDFYLKL